MLPYVTISMYIKINEFILMSPVDQSGLLSLFSWKLSLQQWKSWFPPPAILLINCSIPGYMYSSIRIVNLQNLTCRIVNWFWPSEILKKQAADLGTVV
jgi:hypothetical protein